MMGHDLPRPPIRHYPPPHPSGMVGTATKYVTFFREYSKVGEESRPAPPGRLANVYVNGMDSLLV